MNKSEKKDSAQEKLENLIEKKTTENQALKKLLFELNKDEDNHQNSKKNKKTKNK